MKLPKPMTSVERRWFNEVGFPMWATKRIKFKPEFQPCKIRLSPRRTYTPDFRVVWADGGTAYIEVKAVSRSKRTGRKWVSGSRDSIVRLEWAAKEWADDEFYLYEWDGEAWANRRVEGR